MFGKNSAKKVLQIITSRRTLIVIVVFGLFLYSDFASAQATYNALVTIPGIPSGASVQVYLSGLYTFLISVVGIVAMGAIVIGGARYLTSAGNPSAIEDAKHTIYSAIIGLLLAITSWVIIIEINPDIAVLKNPAMPWEAVGYSPGASDPRDNCTLPGEQDKTTSPCHCVDDPNREVAFTQPVLTGPYVVSTSIAPCAVGVPANTSSITFTFNEPLDPLTIDTTNVNSNLRTVLGGFSSYTPNTLVTATLNGNDLVITWPGSTLNAGPRHLFIIRGIVDRGGASNDAWVKNLSGVGMATNYWVTFVLEPAFTGVACSSALPSVVTCKEACSDNYTPSVPNLNPPGYHCMKADLRVGTTPDQKADTLTVKVNQRIYWDGKTYSIDYGWPSLKTDVPATDSKFNNGIDSYYVEYTKGAGVYYDAPWADADNILSYLGGVDFVQTETTTCNLFLGWLTKGGNTIFGLTNGFGYFSFATAGEYKVILNVFSKNCSPTQAIDTVFIKVE